MHLKWNLNKNYLEQPVNQRKRQIFGLEIEVTSWEWRQTELDCLWEVLVWSEQNLQLKLGELLGNSLVFLLL